MYFNYLYFNYFTTLPITTCCSVLPPEIVMHDDVHIGGHSENNNKCVVPDDKLIYSAVSLALRVIFSVS